MPLVTYAARSVGWTSYAAGLLTDGDLDQLVGDVIAIRVFHSNDGDTVRLTVDDDDPRLVGGQTRWWSSASVIRQHG